MSKIHEAFENGKAFIAFVTGGDPDLDTTKKIIKEMEKAQSAIEHKISNIETIVDNIEGEMDVQPINCLTH